MIPSGLTSSVINRASLGDGYVRVRDGGLVAAVADARDWEAFRSLFADEITIDFGAVKPPQRTRADDLVAWARKAFSRMKTHHVGNHHMLDKRLEVVTDRSRAVAGREPRRELRFETKTSYNRGGGIHELGQGVRWRRRVKLKSRGGVDAIGRTRQRDAGHAKGGTGTRRPDRTP